MTQSIDYSYEQNVFMTNTKMFKYKSWIAVAALADQTDEKYLSLRVEDKLQLPCHFSAVYLKPTASLQIT